MRVPNFIVVGAHKAGTTSLHHYLAQHPDIALNSIKGTDLLARRNITTLDEAGKYLAQFEGAGDTQLLGEVSSVYFHQEEVAKKIKQLFPDVKIIAVLREPVERAYSHAIWKRYYTPEQLRNFTEVVLNSKVFLHPGFYGKHVETYLSLFDREQVKLMWFDDFKNNPQQFFKELYEFIGADSSFVPTTEKKYHTGKLKVNNFSNQLLETATSVNAGLKKLIPESMRSWIKKTLKARTYVPKMKMPDDFRAKVRECYRDDILLLQKLTGLDCSHWLDDASVSSQK